MSHIYCPVTSLWLCDNRSPHTRSGKTNDRCLYSSLDAIWVSQNVTVHSIMRDCQCRWWYLAATVSRRQRTKADGLIQSLHKLIILSFINSYKVMCSLSSVLLPISPLHFQSITQFFCVLRINDYTTVIDSSIPAFNYSRTCWMVILQKNNALSNTSNIKWHLMKQVFQISTNIVHIVQACAQRCLIKILLCTNVFCEHHELIIHH